MKSIIALSITISLLIGAASGFFVGRYILDSATEVQLVQIRQEARYWKAQNEQSLQTAQRDYDNLNAQIASMQDDLNSWSGAADLLCSDLVISYPRSKWTPSERSFCPTYGAADG